MVTKVGEPTRITSTLFLNKIEIDENVRVINNVNYYGEYLFKVTRMSYSKLIYDSIFSRSNRWIFVLTVMRPLIS